MRHEDELRRLLRGGPIPAEDRQLAQTLRELRSGLSAPPSEDTTEDHLAAITAAATEAAHEAPTARPVDRLRRWGRRVAAVGALKIATVATVAAAATSGGLAATGSLPQPVQQQVSDVLSQVGITVPSGTETAEHERPDEIGTTPAEPAVVDSAPPTSLPPTEPPSDGAADERAPADVPEQAPVEPSDDRVPSDDRPAGEPDETHSETGSEYPYRSDAPADPPTEAPAEPRATENDSPSSGPPDADRGSGPEDPGP